MRLSNDRPNQVPRDLDITYGARGRFLFVVCFSVLIAAIGPSARFAEVLSTFLLFGAGITVLGAMYKCDKLVSKHLTDWDVSLALIAFGLLAHFFASG